MMTTLFKLRSFVSTILIVALSSFAFAQSVESDEDGPKIKDRQYLNLTVGVEHDLKAPFMPEKFDLKGTFRKGVDLKYAKEIKVLRFTPKKEGVTTLTIHDKSGKMIAEYRIDVRQNSLDKVVREVRGLLGDIEGITIKIANNKVVVDGQVILPRDMQRIHAVIEQYPDQAAILVTLSPVAMQKIAEFIERDINNPEIQVRSINDKIILEGQAGSEDEKAKAEVIAKTYMPNFVKEAGETSIRDRLKNFKEPIVNLLTVKALAPPPPGKTIKMVIHYVELNKDYSRGFRFQWTPDLKDGSGVNFTADSRSPSNIVSTISGTISNLLPKLNSAKQHGHARVLQSSSLIVLDGKTGTLNNISQIPYQTISANGTPITQFAPAGLQTTITPAIQGARSDSVLLTLAFKVSALTGMTNAGPMISESQINTDIIVRSGQSAAIGGLISNDEGTAYNKLPPETSANPIFSLYASKDFRRKQSQFVVFVTPIIMTSASAGADKIKEKFKLDQ